MTAGLAAAPGALLLAALVGVLVGGGTAALCIPVLRWLPATAPGEPAYRELAVPRFVIGTGLLAAGTATVAVVRLEAVWWPIWFVLATLGGLLATVDLTTTWLPSRLVHPFWVALTAAAVVAAGWSAGRPDIEPAGGLLGLLRIAVCAAAWGVLFWLVWLVSRQQIGFGDVRLAFGLGAATGAAGWTTSYLCLLAGTVVGAGWGLAHRLRNGRRPGPFPYGLALYLGCPLGLLIGAG